MGRRTLLLIAALVVAALGTVLVFLYAKNAQDAATDAATKVTVLVAKDNIAQGTNGQTAASNGAFVQQEIPKANVVPGALSDATPLTNLVALVPIYAGQQIIAPQWGTSATGVSLAIPDGKVAIQVTLGDPERVSGFVAPGSHVAIFTTGKPGSGTPGQTPQGPVATALLPDVEVLAVGSITTTSGGSTNTGTGSNAQQVPAANLTLAVDQAQAEKILYVTKAGGAYSGMVFGLLTKNSPKIVVGQQVNEGNLFK